MSSLSCSEGDAPGNTGNWQEAFLDLEFRMHSPGVLLITINRPDTFNATDLSLHKQLERVWAEVAVEPAVNVAVITGAGAAFSAGGEFDMIDSAIQNLEGATRLMESARNLVYGITSCEKPIISAINGPAVGAGLVIALLADISLMAEEARITDGHLRLGVAAGDHAAMLWPLLCSFAKAKYYLLTSDFIGGREAERIGLVSRCVPGGQLLGEALAVAEKLAAGPQQALRLTKRSLNQWLEMTTPMFEASLAFEILTFMGPDVAEGLAALREKRPPIFPSAAQPPVASDR